MCAIVDANVVHEVFQPDRPEAGVKFFDWINRGRGRVIAGGKLLAELSNTKSFREWAHAALQSGRMERVDDGKVDAETAQLLSENLCKSNDHHVIALARIGGARLLYSNDRDLQTDFKNKALINDPRGKVYSTSRTPDFEANHKKLLEDKTLCRG